MRKCLLVLLLLLMALPASAQIGNDEVKMVPFISAPLNIQGLRPDGWVAQENTEGVFIRVRDPLDLTAMIIQAQDTTKNAFMNSVLTSFQVEADLAVVDTLESDFFTWEIYQFERMQGERELIVDMGVAEDSEAGRVYYVLMQTTTMFYDNLHENAFLPAITWLSPIQVYEDLDETLTIPIPVRWTVTEADDFVQVSNPEETISIFVQAIESDDPIATTEALLAEVNPNFDETFDEEVHKLEQIEDPERLGELEAVYIIDWINDEESQFVLQSVTRVYEGIAYITVIAGDVDSIIESEQAITLIDSGYQINALLEANDETTTETDQ